MVINIEGNLETFEYDSFEHVTSGYRAWVDGDDSSFVPSKISPSTDEVSAAGVNVGIYYLGLANFD